MNNVRVDFEGWEEGSMDDARRGKTLVGYQEICCRMIFYIKMDGRFTRNDHYDAVGHTDDPPSSVTYFSVMSRDSVRIAFTLASLNGVEIRANYNGNAYLNAKFWERIWTVAGLGLEVRKVNSYFSPCTI